MEHYIHYRTYTRLWDEVRTTVQRLPRPGAVTVRPEIGLCSAVPEASIGLAPALPIESGVHLLVDCILISTTLLPLQHERIPVGRHHVLIRIRPAGCRSPPCMGMSRDLALRSEMAGCGHAHAAAVPDPSQPVAAATGPGAWRWVYRLSGLAGMHSTPTVVRGCSRYPTGRRHISRPPAQNRGVKGARATKRGLAGLADGPPASSSSLAGMHRLEREEHGLVGSRSELTAASIRPEAPP